MPALPQPGGEEEAEVVRADPVSLEEVVVGPEAGLEPAAKETRPAAVGSGALRGGVALHEAGAPAHAGPLPRRPAEGEPHRRRVGGGRAGRRRRLVLLAGRGGGHHARVGIDKVTYEKALFYTATALIS